MTDHIEEMTFVSDEVADDIDQMAEIAQQLVDKLSQRAAATSQRITQTHTEVSNLGGQGCTVRVIAELVPLRRA